MEIAKQLAASAASVRANLATPASARNEGSVEAFALQWFEQMRTGKINRSQLSAAYSAQLPAHAIEGMSRFLQAYEFGATPLGAHVVRTHVSGHQTFYLTKLLFPRGDAASLLFGFDSEGKVTGVTLMSMAGD